MFLANEKYRRFPDGTLPTLVSESRVKPLARIWVADGLYEIIAVGMVKSLSQFKSW